MMFRLRSILALIIMSSTLIACGGGTGSGGGVIVSSDEADGEESVNSKASGTIPGFELWEANMLQWGGYHCDRLANSGISFDEKLAGVYYDQHWVFQRIAEYTGDGSWYTCADRAKEIYRDNYVLANGGFIPGFWIFPHGMTEDYIRTGDATSLEALNLMSTNAAFSRDTTGVAETQHVNQSRETAYVIMTYLMAQDVGLPPRLRLGQLIEQAYGHLDQWFAQRNSPVQPFMVSLTAHALIMWHERSGDGRVVGELVRAADAMWEEAWIPEAQSFYIIDGGGRQPAPDLNLLIAPMYAWLYQQTGEQRFADRGDQIFAGGVNAAFLEGGKQFDQNYRWSFDYVRWRQ